MPWMGASLGLATLAGEQEALSEALSASPKPSVAFAPATDDL